MEKFIKYLENQKRLSVELGTPQGEIKVLEAIIKEAKKQLLIHSVVSSFICHDADTYGESAKCSEMCVDCRDFNK